MGYLGKFKERQLAQDLRRQGLSYKEIRSRVKVSKSTLSQWCREIELLPEYIERLDDKKKVGRLKGSIIGAKKQQMARIENTRILIEQGIKEGGSLNRRDVFIAGTMLFASEGTKRDGNIDFANSDPRIISFIMKWLKEICLIPIQKIRAKLYIHDNLNESEAKNFWSTLTNIPLQQFTKSYVVKSKDSNNRVYKNIHSYGVLTVRVSDSKTHRRIMGWIQGILSQSFPGSSAVEHAAVK